MKLALGLVAGLLVVFLYRRRKQALVISHDGEGWYVTRKQVFA